MYRRKAAHLGSVAIGISTLLTACQTPKHTDLLIFGTNTQFGLSVATDATANPGVVIGFKRQEVVLMPLYVNAGESTIHPTGDPDAHTATAEGKYRGENGEEKDTYSVLASFGATGEGGSAGSGKVQIAQYFATGLAARTLAAAGGALVSTSDKAATSLAVDEETAKALAAYAEARNADLDAIMTKLIEGDGKVTEEELDNAFQDVASPPPPAVKKQWATNTEQLRAGLRDSYQFQLKKILANVNKP